MAQVRIIFNQGEANEYVFPQVQSETGSNEPIDKSVIIEGNRGDGSIYIPGGKKSLRIPIRGILVADDYDALTTLMNTMKSKLDTSLSTLKLQHYSGGWQNDWAYNVRMIGEINFGETLRTDSQPYSIEFLVISY